MVQTLELLQLCNILVNLLENLNSCLRFLKVKADIILATTTRLLNAVCSQTGSVV